MSISDRSASTLRSLAVGITLGFGLVTPGATETVLKIGSLAPDGSSWIKALRNIDAEIRTATAGEVRLKIYPGGVQGDEDVMLRKIRIGQLHGAGLGGTGITHILPDVLALEMPFLFDSYEEVDYVLTQMADHYRQAFLDAGFVQLGWSDIGFVFLMTKHPVRSVEDIRGHKVWRLQDEPITGVLFEKAGVTSVPLGIPDVLLGLQTNLVDIVYASPAAAIVLQWFTRVRHYTDLPINYSIGAFLVQRKAFERLTQQQQQQLLEISTRHIRVHNQRGRRDNQDALEIMQREGVSPISSPPEAVAGFHQLVDESVPELVGEAFSRTVYEQILEHLAEFRGKAVTPVER
jgi:TRAP-type C4-dicarboxylate transport system substrate-binding protein